MPLQDLILLVTPLFLQLFFSLGFHRFIFSWIILYTWFHPSYFSWLDHLPLPVFWYFLGCYMWLCVFCFTFFHWATQTSHEAITIELDRCWWGTEPSCGTSQRGPGSQLGADREWRMVLHAGKQDAGGYWWECSWRSRLRLHIEAVHGKLRSLDCLFLFIQ